MTDHVPGAAQDTSREALRVQYAALRRLTPAQRIALMDDLTQLARSLTLSGLRRRHPNLSEAEIDVRFFELALGKELAHQVLEHRRTQAARLAP